MDKEAILRTGVLRYEDDCFVVESPLCDRVLGVGDSPEEAWQIFGEILEDTCELYKAGKLAQYDKPGRPSKGKKSINIEIRPEIKQEIAKEAKNLGISQGEVVEWLFMKARAEESLKQAKAS